MSGNLFVRAGSSRGAPFELVITPETAGWSYSSLRTLTLPPGGTVAFGTGDTEMILLPLTGSATVEIGGQEIELAGRTAVFDAVTDFAYLPRGCTAAVSSAGGGSFALPGARATRTLPFRYGAADQVSVEVRGAGPCSRQVNNFATPDAFETDKLIACEVLTPAANWSSYPPHKHDESTGAESELEEIYYYRFRAAAGPADKENSGERTRLTATGSDGVGYQRVYGTAARPIEILEQVTDGDAVLIPHGWHGPSIASPSHDMYYLNVMAGPEPTRRWQISDDPAHGWIRDTWADQRVDPRLPFYR